VTRVLLVALFGAAGALSRYAVDEVVPNAWDGRLPLGTLLINVVGSFALGVLVAVTTERLLLGPDWRVALGAGFLSAFTTFSTYAVDTVRLAEDSQWTVAFVNVFAMLALGLFAAFAGLALGRSI
jgi:CrcB protein